MQRAPKEKGSQPRVGASVCSLAPGLQVIQAVAVFCHPGSSDLGVHTCGKPFCLNQKVSSPDPIASLPDLVSPTAAARVQASEGRND